MTSVSVSRASSNSLDRSAEERARREISRPRIAPTSPTQTRPTSSRKPCRCSAEHRQGFRELVGRVCVGEVGAILGLEISRLARSSADLSRLLELARLTDTLVIDADGVYDLGDFNDRLLLGLKSTMSE